MLCRLLNIFVSKFGFRYILDCVLLNLAYQYLRGKKTKVWRPVNHNTYHRQCGMTQLCYLGVLSTFVLYLAFYLVLSFLVHICYCPRRKMILLWLKNLVMITIFMGLFSKSECFLANIEGIKFEKFSGQSAPTMLGPPLILNEKRFDFPKKLKALISSNLETMYKC